MTNELKEINVQLATLVERSENTQVYMQDTKTALDKVETELREQTKTLGEHDARIATCEVQIGQVAKDVTFIANQYRSNPSPEKRTFEWNGQTKTIVALVTAVNALTGLIIILADKIL